MKEIIITDKTQNQRLDKYLMKYLNDAPKGFIYKMIRKKNIKLNGIKVQGDEVLINGDILQIFLSDETVDKFSSEKSVNESAGNIEVIYEDDNILVINKPWGILTHPDSPNDKDTLIDRALLHLQKSGNYEISKTSVFTPAFCNRLDMNTTGIVVCGKNLDAVQQLNFAMKHGACEKYYLSIVNGEIHYKGTLKGFHEKDGKANVSVISSEEKQGAKAVETVYEPLISKGGFTLVKIRLVTGKSHQIRVHMAGIGHEVLGDRKYSTNSNYKPKHQMLHASSIVFSGLKGNLEYLNKREFTAPKPKEFVKYEKIIFE